MEFTLVIAPMTGGKTTELLIRAKKAADAGLKVAYINSIKDTRNDEVFSTHNAQLNKDCVGYTTMKVNRLSDVSVSSFDLILVDESHFFTDLNEEVRCWILKKRKSVVVAALSGDTELELIGQYYMLLPLHPHIVRLTSRCKRCGGRTEAPYTILKSSVDDRLGQYKVGGTESYEAVCLDHYLEKQKEKIRAST